MMDNPKMNLKYVESEIRFSRVTFLFGRIRFQSDEMMCVLLMQWFFILNVVLFYFEKKGSTFKNS